LQRGPSRFRRAVFGAIAGVTAFGTLSGLAVQAASAAPTGNNLAGADRYQTAGNLNAAKFGAAGIGTVLLADAIPGTPGSGAGGHQSDALAVSGYAGLNHDGLLLTDTTNTVPANTMSALSTLKVKNVIAVGGSAAISSAQVAQLTAAGYTVTQPFAGADRYATMQMIDNSFTPSTVGKDPSGNNTAILASGDYAHLVDALAAGGLAYAKKFPVILTPTGSTTLGSQASSEISSLQIKHLIVVGGTASIPSSQYTPNPSGVTTVDVLSGADRSATSEAIEKAEVATYGFSTTKLGIAAGSTFVGSTSQVQNDGADALSSAPYLGDPEPMCVTNGPTDVGSAPKCVSDVNPTTVDWLTGTANLPASQQSTILAGSSGGGAAGAYPVSGGSLSATASTAAAPNQGVQTYTITGLPANTPVDIALFPCQGNAQTGNNTVNGAPTTSGGKTTFTAPGGTTPVAGSAIGEGTSQINTTGNGAGGAFANQAYIASVNGVPTAGAAPVTQYVAPAGSTLTFVVNSKAFDCAVPVVYTVPSGITQTVGSTAVSPLLVNANGTPQTGYAVDVGGPTLWSGPAAPATSTPYDVQVVFNAGTSFQGLAVCTSDATPATVCPAGITTGTIYSYNDGTAGDSYGYYDKTPLTATVFQSILSGPVTGYLPNTTTAQTVPGDIVTIGSNGIATTGYSGSTPANFQIQSGNAFPGGSTASATVAGCGVNTLCDEPSTVLGATYAAFAGDVPAAPTNVTATSNGCATTGGGGVCNPGVIVSWTPPTNPDVSGAEATPDAGAAGNVTDAAGGFQNATYTVYRETVSGSTFGSPTRVATVSVVGSTWAGTAPSNNTAVDGGITSVTSPQAVDVAPLASTSVVYFVAATPSKPSSSGCTTVGGQAQADVPAAGGTGPCTGPASAASAQVTGTAAAAPTMKAVTIVPGTANPGSVAAPGTPPAFPAGEGEAIVTYNTGVTCLSGAGPDFSYSNTGGSPKPITGATCAKAPAGNYNGSAVDNSANTLIVTFAPFTTTTVSGTTTYTANQVAPPANGDTFTYTAPASPTTANAVYSGPTGSPTYASTQTVTSNGGALSSSNALAGGYQPYFTASAASAAAKTITLTYSEPVTCATVDADASDFTVSSPTGTPIVSTGATCAGASNTKVVLSFAALTATNTYTVTAKNGTDGSTVTGATTGGTQGVGDSTSGTVGA